MYPSSVVSNVKARRKNTHHDLLHKKYIYFKKIVFIAFSYASYLARVYYVFTCHRQRVMAAFIFQTASLL